MKWQASEHPVEKVFVNLDDDKMMLKKFIKMNASKGSA